MKGRRRLLILSGLLAGLTTANGQDNESFVAGHVRLDEVLVKGYRPPVEQRGDTVVFNANAFRLPQGAYLEALVRRIPGLQYDSKTQSILYNGYTISEIVLNGKEFFRGNRQMALENLPASFISQVKVYDKATEEEKATGVKTGEKHYVLDLTTRRQMNGTVIASAEAGYGNQGKKDLNAQLFRFNDQGDNLSVLASSTNRNATSSYKDNLSNSIGVNLNRSLREGLTLAASTDYRYSREGNYHSANSEQYLNYGSQYSSATGFSLGKTRELNAALEVKWELDPMTRWDVSGTWNCRNGRHSTDQRSASFSRNPENDLKDPFRDFDSIPRDWLINDNREQSLLHARQHTYQLRSSITRKTGRKGSNISLTLQANGDHRQERTFTGTATLYFRLKAPRSDDSLLYQRQYIASPTTTNNYQLSVAYTHAFTRQHRLQLMYGLLLKDERKSTDTYDLPPVGAAGYLLGQLPPDYADCRTDSLSSHHESRTTGHRFSLRYNYSSRRVFVTAGLSVQPQGRSIERIKGHYSVDTTLHAIEWRPAVSFSYRHPRLLVSLGYAGSTRQPSLTHLIAPADYSSPLRIVRSNPSLKPSYYHQVQFMLNRPRQGLLLNAVWTQELNSITRATRYHRETGGVEIQPVNVNGNWSLKSSVGYDRRLQAFRLYLNGGSGYFRTVTLLNEGLKEEADRSCTGNWTANSTLRLSYLPTWGNIDLCGEWQFSQSHNSLRDRNTFARNYTVSIESTVNLPGHLELGTDACYYSRQGTGIKGSENDEWLWNLKLTYKCLKKQRMEVSFYWADILNDKKSYSQTVTSSGFTERYQPQLRSYWLVALKYRIS